MVVARCALLQACLQGPDPARLREIGAQAGELLLAAAGVGLFLPAGVDGDPADPIALLPLLGRRGHAIRCATPDDLPDLLRLEADCWTEALRSAPSQLAARLGTHPEDQLVLLHAGAVVGVIYSQRTAEGHRFEGITAATVDALHEPQGPVVQLIAINVAPELQHLQLGDELLEFMLVWRRLQGTRTVIAISRCRDFDPAGRRSLAQYIHARNAHGRLADPILRFHELHGARIELPVPGYRPADHANQGCGVLVRYDLPTRRRTDAAATAPAAAASAGVLQAEIEGAVRAALAGQPHAYAPDRPLMEMGLDSADVLALRDRLGHRFGLSLATGFFFEHNTVAKMVRALSPPAEVAPTAPGQAATAPLPAHEPIAIVGIACRLPGGIASVQAFAEALDAGRCMVGPLPEGRWEWPSQVEPQGRHAGIARGGFLADVDTFDAPFFRISPAEAQAMDPQQRLLLELCWEAVEQAGHDPLTLAGSETGVFIGASGCDYARLQEQSGLPVEAHQGTGQSLAVLANRVSYFLDLQGPSLVLDTACSASLVAVHEAIRALRAGECSQALVGGINLLLHPASSIAYHQAGMLARDGLCRTFDADAGGYVRSEGAVVFLLKPLPAAQADGDHVHAVILGSACRHGGQAAGLTVPHPGQQARLLQAAWNDARVSPADLGYIEAHGTGTPLGDPIEVQGIRQARAEALGEGSRPEDFPCGIGSVKTQLGHLEAGAGAAGLLKVVLALAQERIAPTLHFRRLNPQIQLAGSGLHVVERRQAWPRGERRRVAGVSSFGSGGTNAHVVVAEGPVAPAADVADTGPVVVLLSARTRDRLQAYAARVADWLATPEGASVPLAQLAWQLEAGRTLMEERLALQVSNREELIARLRQCAAGELAALAAPAAQEPTSPSLGGKRRRVPVPTYPFASHRYWIGADQPMLAAPAAAPPPLVLAPHWRACAAPSLPLEAGRRIVVIGATAEAVGELRRDHADVHALAHAAAADMRALGALDDMLWLAPSEPEADALLPLFRLVRALLEAGAGERALRLTLVTTGTQAVAPDDAPHAGHAGVHGFAGALAQEQPRWLVRCLDIESPVALRTLLQALRHPAWDVLAHRAGQWLQRRFVPVQLPA
ncbi:MAG TPA: beta-ketoacyl synthase N-terminal-like domain-containing protein, partial [Ramlibacter sp.]